MKKPTSGIGAHPPADAAAWISQGKRSRVSKSVSKSELYTARLTIDVTPAQRSKIKIAAIERGVTVSELLRQLLEREVLGRKSK